MAGATWSRPALDATSPQLAQTPRPHRGQSARRGNDRDSGAEPDDLHRKTRLDPSSLTGTPPCTAGEHEIATVSVEVRLGPRAVGGEPCGAGPGETGT